MTSPRAYSSGAMSCLFCKVVAREIPATIVYEDEHAVAFRDIRPVAPTHVLVVPKRHLSAIHELKAGDAETIGQVFVAARNVAHELGLESAGYRLVVNDGDAAGQTVHHVHVHVLGGRDFAWPPG